MIKNILRFTVWTMFAAALSIMIGVQVHWIIQRHTPPHRYLATWAEASRIKPGSEIRIRYIFERVRYCETWLNLFIISRPDNFIVWRNRIPGGATLLGRREVLNVYPLTPSVGPGDYIFRTISHATCTDGAHSSTAPDVVFEVIGPDAT